MNTFPMAAADVDGGGGQAGNDSGRYREKGPASTSGTASGTRGRQFKCEHCDRLFSTRGNKMRHIQATHNPAGAKMYPCDTCGKEFKRKEDLTMHIRVHTGEGIFLTRNVPRVFLGFVLHCGRLASRQPFRRLQTKLNYNSIAVDLVQFRVRLECNIY